jgi:hypothetical protein
MTRVNEPNQKQFRLSGLAAADLHANSARHHPPLLNSFLEGAHSSGGNFCWQSQDESSQTRRQTQQKHSSRTQNRTRQDRPGRCDSQLRRDNHELLIHHTMPAERFKWCPRVLVRKLALIIGRPVFEHDLREDGLRRLADENDPTQVDELQFVQSMGYHRSGNSSSRILRRVLHAANIYVILKAIFYCYFMLFKYNVFSKENRLDISLDASTGRPLYSFACLASNCSSLFDPLVNATRSQLIMDELPIFSICQPLLSTFNAPFQNINALGFFLLVVVSNVYLIFVYAYGWAMARMRTRNQTLLFAVAPKLAKRLCLSKAREYAAELQESLFQYQRKLLARRNKSMRIGFFDWQPATTTNQSAGWASRSCLDPRYPYHHPSAPTEPGGERQKRTAATTDTVSSTARNEAIDKFAYDCLPLIRTDWWHRIVVSVLFALLIILLALDVIILAVESWNVDSYLVRKRILMSELHQAAHQSDCSIWLKSRPGAEQQVSSHDENLVELSQLKYGWDFFGLLTNAIMYVCWPNCVTIVPAYYALLIAWDLRCFISELKFKLGTFLPVVEDMSQRMAAAGERRALPTDLSRADTAAGGLIHANDGQLTNESNYEKLAQKFTNDVRVLMFTLRNKPFLSLHARLENHQFIMAECFGERSATNNNNGSHRSRWPQLLLPEIMEKLYVQFRMMDDLARDVEVNVAVVTFFSNILEYFITLFTVLSAKSTRTVATVHYVCIIFSITFSFTLTLNSAILHAKVSGV